jgi:hypothetical protein
MGHPLAFASHLHHLGSPAETHLRRQGLPTLCEDPNVFVPLHKAWAFFDSAARSEDPMFGWYVGRFVGDHNMNASLMKRIEHAPTLYQGLKQLARLCRREMGSR